MLGLWACALHLLPEELLRYGIEVDFPVQPLEDAGWEGRHDAIAIGAFEDDAHGKPSGLTRRW
jgi:hypothetical protein